MTTDKGIACSTTDTLSGENSVDRGGNTDIKQQGHASNTVNYMKTSSSHGDNNMCDHDSSADHNNNMIYNPIYEGYDEETESIYTDIDITYQVGTKMESSPKSEYKFDSAIYDGEEDENAHALHME